MTIHETLQQIQSELKAPKSQTNTFGKYKYRSCEDILEALKPILKKHKCSHTFTDELSFYGDRFYIKSIATLWDAKGENISASAYAREPESKKGMDTAQITGATSSYARKYAANALYGIDDQKDADATNKHEKPATNPQPKPKKSAKADDITEPQRNKLFAMMKDKQLSRKSQKGLYDFVKGDRDKMTKTQATNFIKEFEDYLGKYINHETGNSEIPGNQEPPVSDGRDTDGYVLE